MERIRLNTVLRLFFDVYESARYQGVVIAVASERDLKQLQSQVEAILLDRDIWTLPGSDGAPAIPCSRQAFNELAFSNRRHGLVIISPLDWMLDWPEQEKAVFWTRVADHYGRHSVLVIVVETPSQIKQLRISLVKYKFSGLDVSVWLSKHQTIDGLVEVLS